MDELSIELAIKDPYIRSVLWHRLKHPQKTEFKKMRCQLQDTMGLTEKEAFTETWKHYVKELQIDVVSLMIPDTKNLKQPETSLYKNPLISFVMANLHRIPNPKVPNTWTIKATEAPNAEYWNTLVLVATKKDQFVSMVLRELGAMVEEEKKIRQIEMEGKLAVAAAEKAAAIAAIPRPVPPKPVPPPEVEKPKPKKKQPSKKRDRDRRVRDDTEPSNALETLDKINQMLDASES